MPKEEGKKEGSPTKEQTRGRNEVDGFAMSKSSIKNVCDLSDAGDDDNDDEECAQTCAQTVF
jgi:hypothetical protein